MCTYSRVSVLSVYLQQGECVLTAGVSVYLQQGECVLTAG